MKTGSGVIFKVPSFNEKDTFLIFLAVYIACLGVSLSNVGEIILGWAIAALWLFLVTTLIYTPDMIQVDLVVWCTLGLHLAFQVIHAALVGSNPWVTSMAAFSNAFSGIMKESKASIVFAFGGFALMIAQISLEGASVYNYISFGLCVLPIFHVYYRFYKAYSN